MARAASTPTSAASSAPCRSRASTVVERARIVGAGATATSALVALGELGARRVEVVRPSSRGRRAARGARCDRSASTWSARVSTRPPHGPVPRDDRDAARATRPSRDAAADALAASGGLLLDVAYGHWPTHSRRVGASGQRGDLRTRDAAAPGAAAGADLRRRRRRDAALPDEGVGASRRCACARHGRLDECSACSPPANRTAPNSSPSWRVCPAGVPVSRAAIQADLARRKLGYGRGSRMKFEEDELTISGGVRHGLSLGSPIALRIGNTEWPKWVEVMSPEPVELTDKSRGRGAALTRPRPGHADLVGMQKYGFDEARPILERASARETAARVALGAVARALPRRARHPARQPHPLDRARARARRTPRCRRPTTSTRSTPIRCAASTPRPRRCMVAEVDAAHKDGDTLGGIVEVLAYGLPPGLGSHVHWDRRLDAQARPGAHEHPGDQGRRGRRRLRHDDAGAAPRRTTSCSRPTTASPARATAPAAPRAACRPAPCCASAPA